MRGLFVIKEHFGMFRISELNYECKVLNFQSLKFSSIQHLTELPDIENAKVIVNMELRKCSA